MDADAKVLSFPKKSASKCKNCKSQYWNDVVIVVDMIIVGSDGKNDVRWFSITVDVIHVVFIVVSSADRPCYTINYILWTHYGIGASIRDCLITRGRKITSRNTGTSKSYNNRNLKIYVWP